MRTTHQVRFWWWKLVADAGRRAGWRWLWFAGIDGVLALAEETRTLEDA